MDDYPSTEEKPSPLLPCSLVLQTKVNKFSLGSNHGLLFCIHSKKKIQIEKIILLSKGKTRAESFQFSYLEGKFECNIGRIVSSDVNKSFSAVATSSHYASSKYFNFTRQCTVVVLDNPLLLDANKLYTFVMVDPDCNITYSVPPEPSYDFDGDEEEENEADNEQEAHDNTETNKNAASMEDQIAEADGCITLYRGFSLNNKLEALERRDFAGTIGYSLLTTLFSSFIKVQRTSTDLRLMFQW